MLKLHKLAQEILDTYGSTRRRLMTEWTSTRMNLHHTLVSKTPTEYKMCTGMDTLYTMWN